jgi:hypothetical protein
MRCYVSVVVYPGAGAAVAVGPRVNAGSLARGKRGERGLKRGETGESRAGFFTRCRPGEARLGAPISVLAAGVACACRVAPMGAGCREATGPADSEIGGPRMWPVRSSSMGPAMGCGESQGDVGEKGTKTGDNGGKSSWSFSVHATARRRRHGVADSEIRVPYRAIAHHPSPPMRGDTWR